MSKSDEELTGKQLLICLALTFAIPAAMSNPLWQDVEGATKTLDDAGLKPLNVGGYGWLSCSVRDRYRTNFTAVNQNGKEVSGTVCAGFFKGKTIRFD